MDGLEWNMPNKWIQTNGSKQMDPNDSQYGYGELLWGPPEEVVGQSCRLGRLGRWDLDALSGIIGRSSGDHRAIIPINHVGKHWYKVVPPQ